MPQRLFEASLGDTLWHGVAGRGLCSGIQRYYKGGTFHNEKLNRIEDT